MQYSRQSLKTVHHIVIMPIKQPLAFKHKMDDRPAEYDDRGGGACQQIVAECRKSER